MHEIRSSILSGGDHPSTPIARKAKASRDPGSAGSLVKLAIKREETRVTDQRCEDRLRDVVDESVIYFRRRKLSARVVNVSSRGAMLASDVDARIGERLDIQFADKARTRCIVRWVREGRIGVEFTEETIFWDRSSQSGAVFQYGAAPAERDERPPLRALSEREPRQALLRSGTLYWSGISIPVRLRNISSGGARLESGHDICPGSQVELDLGEAGFEFAEVRWCKDGQVGLRFAGEFDLDSLSQPAAAAPRAPNMVKPAYLETDGQADSPWAARFERLTMTELKPPEKS
jgi:hypothetical protein